MPQPHLNSNQQKKEYNLITQRIKKNMNYHSNNLSSLNNNILNNNNNNNNNHKNNNNNNNNNKKINNNNHCINKNKVHQITLLLNNIHIKKMKKQRLLKMKKLNLNRNKLFKNKIRLGTLEVIFKNRNYIYRNQSNKG